MADIHYHNCSTCINEGKGLESSYECSLELGSCPTPFLCPAHGGKKRFKQLATREDAFLCNNGWICECGGTYQPRHEECPQCGRPKPTLDGWNDRGLGMSNTELLTPIEENLSDDKQEVESWTCPSCKDEYEEEDAEDEHKRTCNASGCKEVFCDEGNCGDSTYCEDCNEWYCCEHSYHCQCCKRPICVNCRDNHGT